MAKAAAAAAAATCFVPNRNPRMVELEVGEPGEAMQGTHRNPFAR